MSTVMKNKAGHKFPKWLTENLNRMVKEVLLKKIDS